jgi:hypothetical protein
MLLPRIRVLSIETVTDPFEVHNLTQLLAAVGPTLEHLRMQFLVGMHIVKGTICTLV